MIIAPRCKLSLFSSSLGNTRKMSSAQIAQALMTFRRRKTVRLMTQSKRRLIAVESAKKILLAKAAFNFAVEVLLK